MSNELNITIEEVTENTAESSTGENKGVTDDHKIVPIANKTSVGDASGTAASTVNMPAESAGSPVSNSMTATSALETVPANAPASGYTAASAVSAAPIQNASANSPASGYTDASAVSAAPVQAASVPAASASGTPIGSVPVHFVSTAPTVENPIPVNSVSTAPAVENPIPVHFASAAPASENPVPIDSGSASLASENPVPSGPVSSSLAAENSASVTETSTTAKAPTPDRSPEPETNTKHTYRTASYRADTDSDFDFDEDERPKKRFFRSKHEEQSRDQLILSRIKDEDLMEYLALEQRRLEFLQQAKEIREKRILTAFQLLISLAAIVTVTYLLKDNPTILISILYIVGIIAALNIWKNPFDKKKDRR